MEGSVVCAARKSRTKGGGSRGRPLLRSTGGSRLARREALADVAAGARGLHHALDAQLVRRHPQRDVVLLGTLVHRLVGLAHDLAEAVVDVLLVPAEMLEVLHPLEVGDDDAAGVGHHVRMTKMPLSLRISSACGWWASSRPRSPSGSRGGRRCRRGSCRPGPSNLANAPGGVVLTGTRGVCNAELGVRFPPPPL